ncbi:MAG: ABC transporter permease [Parachlamydiales bacterium]|nr:ABC transporter permease [Parachlamydiales bacterium]
MLHSFISSLGAYIVLVLDSFGILFSKPPKWVLVQEQLFIIGVMSLPVVAITGFSTGLVLAAQSFFQLSDKGLTAATGLMVAKAMITELGPILTAFMVTGRMGSAMCAELGTMQVSEQVDALRSMAVNPIRYLVVPRIVGGTIMLPFLTIFSVLVGILGGYLISVYIFKMSPASYFDAMPVNITYFDCLTGLIKSFVFGFFFSTICCYKGINTQGGAAGVGRATTSSVVICYSIILVVNFLITFGLNLLRTNSFSP